LKALISKFAEKNILVFEFVELGTKRKKQTLMDFSLIRMLLFLSDSKHHFEEKYLL